MSPLLSLCLTTLDRESLFPQTLRSLASQTFPDLEIVVVDNASRTDYARQAVAALNDPRIRFLRQSERVSMGDNWNRAVALSRGRYVAVCHDDDLYHPLFAGETVDRLERDPSLAFVHTKTLRADEEGVPFAFCDLGWPERVEGRVFRRRMALHPRRSLVEAQSVVMRRSAFDAAGPFVRDWVQVTDAEMWQRLAEHGAVGFLRRPLVTVRLRVAPKAASRRHVQELEEKAELARRSARLLSPAERLLVRGRLDAVVAEQLLWTLLYADAPYLREEAPRMLAQASRPLRMALTPLVSGAQTQPLRAALTWLAKQRRARQGRS